MQPHDMANTLFTDSFTAAAALAGLERQRGWQAEAELARLLKQHGLTTPARPALFATLRQTLGTMMVRAGERLAGAAQGAVAPETAAAASKLRTAG
jgi:hypothetical protein